MPTHLYLLRHATAQDRHLPIPDAQRTLVPKGEQQVRRVAHWCQRQGLLPGRLLSSPLVRARQTADGLAHQLKGCPTPTEAAWLALGTPTARALAALEPLLADGGPPLWLVGHEPDFSALIAALLGQAEPVLLPRKASLTCLAFDDTAERYEQLLWHVPCSLMGD